MEFAEFLTVVQIKLATKSSPLDYSFHLQSSEKVSQEEIDAALNAWQTERNDYPRPRLREHPV